MNDEARLDAETQNRTAQASNTPSMRTEDHNAIYQIMAEVLFVLLPFIVTGMVFFYGGKLHRLVYEPEWSLAASVLSGQAVMKLISGLLAGSEGRPERQKISLWITSVIVLSLAPSLLILTLVLSSETPSRALVISQISFFLIGLVVFIFLGWLGERLLASGKH